MEQEQKKLTITCVYICKENGMVAICEQKAKELPKGKNNELEWKEASILRKPIKKLIEWLSFKSFKVKQEDINEIIGYYNEKLNKNLNPTSRVYRELIQPRMSEGYTVEDFKTIIDNMTAEWMGNSEMAKNLKPTTLFRACHFDEYLNLVKAVDKNKLQVEKTYDYESYKDYAMTNTEI